jgi:hypothetical protein
MILSILLNIKIINIKHYFFLLKIKKEKRENTLYYR